MYYRLAGKKAAIAFTYEDSTPAPEPEEEEDSDESSDTDVETVDLGRCDSLLLNSLLSNYMLISDWLKLCFLESVLEWVDCKLPLLVYLGFYI